MDQKDLDYFKEKLLSEKAQLEEELATVGRINPDNPTDWEPTPSSEQEDRDTDPNVKADNIEEYENRTAILKQLETQLGEVNNALEKIEKGNYGICEVSDEEIEKGRLEANPSARTCIDHMNE